MIACPQCGHEYAAKLPGLTRREADVVAILRAVEQTPVISPTYAEIAVKLGMEKSSVARIVAQLGRKGWITRERYGVRGTRLTPGA